MANIEDDVVNPANRAVFPISVEVKEEESKQGIGSDLGVSSIEKSKAVPGIAVPSMNAPILAAPSDQAIFAISTVDATGEKMVQMISTMAIRVEGVKNDVVEAFAHNLREIQEQVKQILASPEYIQLQQMRAKGDPRSGTVSGVQNAASAAKSVEGDGSDAINLLSTLDRLQVLEKIPPTADVQDTTPPQNPSRSLILPLVATVAMGGALAVGTVQSTTSLAGISSNVMTQAVKLVEQLQPLFSNFTVQDMIQVLYLPIVGSLYLNSWNEAVGNFGNKERNNSNETIQKFAQDVIKMVSDPKSILGMLVSQSAGVALSEQEVAQRTHMLKFIMIGVALSLLNSVEVGSVQGGMFGGIQPEELRDILLDKVAKWGSPKTTTLVSSLIKLGTVQMSAIQREEDRVLAADILVGYVYQKRKLEDLLVPAKVFHEMCEAMAFNPNVQGHG